MERWLVSEGVLPRDARLLRLAIFVREQGFEREFDVLDGTATHVVLYEDDVPLGCCRTFPSAEFAGMWEIGRVCVSEAGRCRGTGGKLVRKAEELARAAGAASCAVSAQVRVRLFYEQLGYVASGEEYLDEFCPHIHMEHEL